MGQKRREKSRGVFTPLIFITLVIAVTLCGIGIGTASAATTVEISPSTKSVALGEEFMVNISVTPDRPIKGMQVDLSFDPSLVTVESVTNGGMFTDIFGAGTIDNEAGKVTGMYGSLTGGATTSEPGTFAVISLKANSTNSGTTTLGLLNVIVVGPEGEVPSTITNGTVSVGVIPPSVTVVYPNGGEILSGTVTVSANASDEDGTVINVEFLYSPDAGSTWTSLGNDTTAPYTYEWDTTTVPNGADYLIKAIATDNDGLTSEDTSDGTFTIENIVIGTKVEISPSTKSVALGEEFMVNISVTPDRPIKGMQVDLSFDPSLVTVESVTNGGMFTDIFGAGTIDNEAGKVTGMYGSLTGGATTSEPGTFAVISLKANSTNSGTTTLGLLNVIVVGPEGEVPSTITNGTVSVSVIPEKPFLIDGYVFYANGTACNGPIVSVTNLNTGKTWEAETNASSNYYRLNLTSCVDVNASEVLRFNVSSPDRTRTNTTEYTVTQDNINADGLFNFNITLKGIHDINITTDYEGAVNGIKITRDGTDVVGPDENLTIGETYKIRYKLVNEGDFNETVHVTVRVANESWSMLIGEHSYSLDAGESDTYYDEWNTSGLAPGNYTITVNASISEDAHPEDNKAWRDVEIVPLPIGDMNRDGEVDFNDVIALAIHIYFGEPVYDDPDVNGDGEVDFNDVIALAIHIYFGEPIYPQ